MKKKLIVNVLIPLLIAVILGFYGAKIAYEFYQVKKTLGERSYNAYAIQYGVYTNPETMKKYTKDLEDYVVTLEDGKYYIYLGFTTNYKNLKKMKKMYEDQDMEVYTKEIYINNQEFVSNLEQFDVLIENSDDDEDIVSVNEAILSSYNEIILGK